MSHTIYNLKTQQSEIIPLSDQEISDMANEVLSSLSVNVREKRNAKLAETDWTQVADAPVSQEDWAAYRELLRSIPEQEGFPNEVTWPTEPVAEVVSE